MVSKTGTLKISVSGTDILDWRVFIDQDIYEAGELEEPLRLPIGEHYFRVESDGFIPFVQKVTIGVKEEIIDVVLKRSCKIEVITYIPDSVCTIEIANEKIKPMEIRTGIDSVEGSQCWISHFYFSGLPEGRCTILLTRQGFQDVANEVNITPARVNIVKINQQPILNTAVLRVFSNPPDLAIRCNGQSFVNKVAEAGVLVTGVAPGKVTLNANGLADIMTVNNVLPGEIRDVPWEINMPQAQYHTLKLVSSPPKAWVFIDGLIQTKPTNAAGMMTVSKLIAGKHDISIVMPNYYPKHLAIYINDIDIKENVVLEPLPSSLIITTNPINATVELIRINDGQKIEGVNTDGTTYFEDINSQQIYQLMVRGDGFSDQLLPQTLNPGELRTRLITLEPVTTISLNVKPFGLAFEIFVNGIRREMINENKAVYLAELVSVDPIPVEVMLCAPDYRSQCWLINIKGGESLPLNVTMVKDPANPFEIRTNIKDRAEIVWVPSGMFTMGNNDDETARPIHNVSLSGFWIYRDEVSVKDFKVFWVEKNYSSKRFPKLPNGWLETYPMVNVTWEQAKEYAEWAGGDLPTEAQWEYAARGDDERIFPWGNDWNGAYCLNPMIKHLSPMPTGTSSEKDVSPSGVRDMAGNVAEWCADYFDEEYYLNSPRFNPQGPETKGRQRSVRGGAWYSWKKRNELFCRTYARSGMPPNFADDWIGFRVVKDGPTE